MKTVQVLIIILTALLAAGCSRYRLDGMIVRREGKIYLNGVLIDGPVKLGGNDTLTATGKGSYVDVRLSGGHQFRLRDGSVSLKGYAKRLKLHLKKGALYTFFRKLHTDEQAEVYTPTSVAGVRGTKFYTETSLQKTYYCVCEGEIEASRRHDGKSLSASVKKGQDLTVHRDKKAPLTAVDSPDMAGQVEEIFQEMGL